MGICDKLANYLSKKLGNKNNSNEEEIAVLKYGIFIFIHTTMAIIATIFLGLLTNTTTEIIIISLVAFFLKRYSGGVHAKTPTRCILTGLILTLLMSELSILICNKLDLKCLIIYIVVMLITSSVILYVKCPVASKDKPINSEEKILRLRKKTCHFICVCIILIVLCLVVFKIYNIKIYKTVAICIVNAIIMQSIMVTKIGSKIIYLFNKLFIILKL